MHPDDEESTETKRVCFQCIGNDYLSKRVQREGVVASCSYCAGVDEPTFTISEMADCVAIAFEQHYERTPDQPNSMQTAMQADRESTYSWDREGEPVDDVIAYAASIGQDIAMDIREVLAERFGDWDSMMFDDETEFAADSFLRAQVRWQRPMDPRMG
ncbi:hypothetical protein [Rhizobium lentis]|nr:hypothetical protein [Rhizobium lentis]MBB4577226.1 hypothetical protein [Rhizobium lentis]